MIEPKSIERLKDQIDIVDIIGHYVELKRAGANYKCVCPFHDDRSPSMSVSPSRQIYHCFACKAGGDAIKFVMEFEKLNYPEAIEKIAQMSNFSLEYTSESGTSRKEDKKILENANAFYRSQFYQNKEALDYVYSRGITDAMIERFELGWAGDSAQTIRLLENNGVTPQEALESGIVKQNERGIYASFISRITFPIYTHTGKLAGFGGRTISGNPAKYVNSPQSALFDKSKLLYGYHLAKQKIFEKKQIIITEGYLDVIMLHLAGFTNAVAVLGTALTEKHLPLIKRDAINVILCFDGDEAGINAAVKSARLLSLNEIDGGVAIIEGGADPADMVKAGKISRLNELFGGATELGEFYIRYIASRYDLTRPVQKQKCLDEILAYTRNLKPVAAASYEPLVAKLLKIEQGSFFLAATNENFNRNFSGGERQIRAKTRNFVVPQISRAQKDLLEISVLKSMSADENFKNTALSLADEKFFPRHAQAFRALASNGALSPQEQGVLREIELDESAMAIESKEKLLRAIATLKLKFYENLRRKILADREPEMVENLEKISKIIQNLKKEI